MGATVAIVHDSLTVFGGNERVLLELIRQFPQADIYTSLATPELAEMMKERSLGRLYFSRLSHWSPALRCPSFFKPYFYHYYWSRLNLDHYQLVISSSHSFCANWVRVKNHHISYIQTPPRFLYGQLNAMVWLRHPLVKILCWPYFTYLRYLDKKYVQKIDVVVANSINIKKRIQKAYQREALILYPPVRIPQKITTTTARTHYLFVSRLTEQKGLRLVIEAFNHNQQPLLVVGTSQNMSKWQKMAQANIKFLGFVSDEKMPNVYARSKALIYAAIDEDFGIAPAEAMAHGLPVIAYKSGGVQETVIDKVTGVFFHHYHASALNRAIDLFVQRKFSAAACRHQAKKFSAEIFHKNLQQLVSQTKSKNKLK